MKVSEFNRPRMGRPGRGRTARLQVAITPELMAWLEAQRGTSTLSDLVFMLLQEQMQRVSEIDPQTS